MINISVNPQKVIGPVNPNLYGEMVEHAYWSVHLGLCSQLLDNGGFELDRDLSHREVAERWQLWSNWAGNVFHAVLDSERPYNGKHSQKVVIDRLERGEVVLQQCFIRLRKGVQNWGFVFMRGEYGTVKVQLRGIDKTVLAEQSFVVNQKEWKEYKLDLCPDKDCKDGVLAIVAAQEGEFWVDQIQLYPSDDYEGHRTRRDMVEHYQALKPTFLRWPGGTYLVWHHWKNAIGPLQDRVYADGRILRDTFGIGHYGEWDPNTFGTDEFIQLCRDCNAEPMINVNLKDTLQNALDWVEYCNGDETTEWGARRAANGHKEPYNVKYWVIDNEPMIMGDKKGYAPELYPLLAAKFAREMKKKDPSIQTFIMGNHNTQELMDRHPEYSELVATHCGDVLDKLCVHCYYDQSYYAPMQGMTKKLGETFDRLKAVLDRHSGGRDCKVFLSEFNPEGNTNVAGNMGQAVETANMFHMLERKCAEGVIDMATMCQLCVNVDLYRGRWLRSAMVQINNETSWTSPMYHVTSMYSNFRQPHMVELTADIPCRDSAAFVDEQIPVIDAVATRSDDGKTIVVKMVNNTVEDTVDTTVDLGGVQIQKATVRELASDSIFDMNTQFIPDKVVPVEYALDAEGSRFTFALKPFSVAVFEIAVK